MLNRLISSLGLHFHYSVKTVQLGLEIQLLVECLPSVHEVIGSENKKKSLLNCLNTAFQILVSSYECENWVVRRRETVVSNVAMKKSTCPVVLS